MAKNGKVVFHADDGREYTWVIYSEEVRTPNNELVARGCGTLLHARKAIAYHQRMEAMR